MTGASDPTKAESIAVEASSIATRGTRLQADALLDYWRTQTFVSGLRVDELSAPLVLDGPMNRMAFEGYIEAELAPTLQPGDVVIADNLSSHRSARVQEPPKAQGNWVLFLLPYNPDLNLIEIAYSRLKAHPRRLKARAFCTFFQSVALICEFIPRKGVP